MYLKIILLHALICFWVSSIQAHSSVGMDTYQKAVLELKCMHLQPDNTFKIRALIVKLNYQKSLMYEEMRFCKAGKYKDEVRIIRGTTVIQVPEWCLLLYLNDLEDIHLKTDSGRQNHLDID